LFVVGSLCAFLGCAGENGARSSQQPRAAKELAPPRVVLLDLEGNAVDLWKDGSARATVVVFARTDCPVSNRFAPEIRRLHQRYEPRGVRFFLVYVDPDEQPEAIRRHLSEYGYTCRALRDPKHALVAQCNATVTPEAVVFDGRQAMTYRGRINDLYIDLGQARPQPTTRDLADAIESTLAGKPVATARTKAVGCIISDLER
jgi:hypothetical protein